MRGERRATRSRPLCGGSPPMTSSRTATHSRRWLSVRAAAACRDLSPLYFTMSGRIMSCSSCSRMWQ